VPPGTMDTHPLDAAGALTSPQGCRDRTLQLDSLPGVLAATLRVVSPLEPGLPGLGRLAHDSLLARIPPRAGGTVTPAPVVQEGRCVQDAPASWGSPSDPEGPCGGHRPSLAIDGDLVLDGGEGQGLLLVTGDL